MSPLWDAAATTGMGGGPFAAAAFAALADFAAAILNHTKYAPKPSTRRTASHSHSRRRREGLGFAGRALSAGAGVTGAGGAEAGAWAVLTGDSVHCFGDGVLIASAFMANLRLGVIASLAVLAHEVPHHMGDLMVLRTGANNRQAAMVKVSLAGAVTALGGLVGYWLVDRLQDYLPYFLVVASSSFIYVALADLIPQLQTRLTARQTLAQIAWLGAGIALVTWVSALAHG